MDPNLAEEYQGRFDDEVPDTDDALGNGYGDDGLDDEAAPPADEPESEEEQEDEADAEAEAEGEQDADAEESEDSEEPDHKEPMLPKSRYDSVRRRLREAEARLAEIEKAKAEQPADETQPVVNFDQKLADLNKQFAQAALDGDADAMASINQQLMATQREQFQSMLAEAQNGAISTSRDSILTDSLVDELVATHEVLNPESEAFDKALVGRINEMREFYESKGLRESEALVKTIEILMPQAFAPQEPTAKTPKGKQQTLQKKVDAANRQPPSLKGVGEDAPSHGRGVVPDINKMSLADLDQLSDSDWDKMLGNTL